LLINFDKAPGIRFTDLEDELEKLLEIQERWEANEAKKKFHMAMAAFKASPPDIEKDKRVNFKTDRGVVNYTHATLANVTEKINAGLSKHGLSAAWAVSQANGAISVTCKITHEQGHSEQTTITASPDTSGSKNSIQAIGSTITYLERYSLLALTGLATSEMDDDGEKAGAKPGGADLMPKEKTPQPPQGARVLGQGEQMKTTAFVVTGSMAKILYGKGEKHGVDEREIGRFMLETFKKASIYELTKQEYEQVEKWADGGWDQ